MKITKHARIRGQQRGISEDCMKLLYAFGTVSKAKNGADLIFLDKHGKRSLENILRKGMQVLDKIKNKQIIYNADNDVIITCYLNSRNT